MTYDVKEGVAVIRLNSPDSKVNSLNDEVTKDVEVVLRDLQANSSVTSGVIISTKPGCFIAGADITWG